MEAFPEDYISHNVPLILLSGIGRDDDLGSERGNARGLLQEGGFRIRRDLPFVTNATAEAVLRAILSFDSTSDGFQKIKVSARDGLGPFKIRKIGRVGQTPPNLTHPQKLAVDLGSIYRLMHYLRARRRLHLMHPRWDPCQIQARFPRH